MTETPTASEGERAAQHIMQMAQAAMKRGHIEPALGLATRIIAMEPDIRPAAEFDGQRRHR
ncbi:MAG: hypothetical protein JWN99_2228, partial [Ilumatobacteraceae bacterium]|nr:hypothetical protein [Ilumatobacteraceae bacterium]